MGNMINETPTCLGLLSNCCIVYMISVSGVVLEDPVEGIAESEHVKVLKEKLSQIGIDIGSCGPGQYSGLLCPMVSY